MSTVFRKLEEDRTGYLTDVLDSVDERWRSEFERFVETGEADDAFLSYLDQSEGAQMAVEVAFKRQAAKFEDLAAELKRRQDQSGTEESHLVPAASTTPTKVAAVVEDALQASSAQRAQVVATSTAALAASMPAEEAVVVKQVARSLESSLAKLADVTR